MINVEIKTKDIYLHQRFKSTNIPRELERIRKIVFIAEHYLTGNGVQPEDYGYPAYPTTSEGS